MVGSTSMYPIIILIDQPSTPTTTTYTKEAKTNVLVVVAMINIQKLEMTFYRLVHKVYGYKCM